METNNSEITVIDLADISLERLVPNPDNDILTLCYKIKSALSNRGLVFVKNHGIKEDEIQNLFSIFDQFLELPDSIKKIYKSNGVKDVHGFMAQNTEKFKKKNKVELRESFNITQFDRKFPDTEIPQFSKHVKEMFEKLTAVANIFLQLLAIGLGLKHDYLLKCHNILDRNINTSILRLIKYPPVEIEPHEGIIRIEEHTDYGTCTLLIQDSEGGLEVKGLDGEWRRVGFLPGSILINTADLLDLWTSGECKAAVHRVVVPEEKEVRMRSRHSMAFFVHPDATTIIKPLNSSREFEDKGRNAKEHILKRVRDSEPCIEEKIHQSG
uniref:Fe2OG dioxygenase domain-containing protein n=1 Tax=Clastoptera arizonana TaxID=38151 RepID=A0A1B6E101_9HEMI